MRRLSTPAAVADSAKLGRIGKFFKEGDLVFTPQIAPPLKDPMSQNIKVTSVQLLNKDLEDAGPMDETEAKKFFIARDGGSKWEPDGVVNNLDGADPENEFKDFAIANVAIQGFVRFSTLPFGDEARGHNFPNLFTQGEQRQRRSRLPGADERGLNRRQEGVPINTSSRRT